MDSVQQRGPRFAGDQVLEWNGEKLGNVNVVDVNRLLSRTALRAPQIHLIVKRPLR